MVLTSTVLAQNAATIGTQADFTLASGVGGSLACFAAGSATLQDCTVSANTAEYAGAGLSLDSCRAVVNGTIITRNNATWHPDVDGSVSVSRLIGGGGLVVRHFSHDRSLGATVSISHTTFADNYAVQGGGVATIADPVVCKSTPNDCQTTTSPPSVMVTMGKGIAWKRNLAIRHGNHLYVASPRAVVVGAWRRLRVALWC